MKLKSMEAWLKPALDDGQEIITYVGIRYDERGRIGYKPTNDLIKQSSHSLKTVLIKME